MSKCQKCGTEFEGNFCPNCGTSEKAWVSPVSSPTQLDTITVQEIKWYSRPWIIIAFLIVFFPVGAYLMWKHTDWKKTIKTTVTVVTGIWFTFWCLVWVAALTDSRPPISELQLKNQEVVLEIGETKEVAVTILPEEAATRSVEYESTNEKIATYEKGIVSAIAEGETTIFVTDISGDVISNKVDVTVLRKGDRKNIENAEKIDDAIKQIGTVSLDSESKITAAREMYDNANDRVKEFVTEEYTLITAEKEYELLEKEKEISDKAKVIDEQIAALGTITLESKDAVASARKAYDSATTEVKAKVQKKQELEAAEKTIKDLEEKKAAEEKAAAEKKAEEERIAAEQREQEQQASSQITEALVWVDDTAAKFHTKSDCSGMDHAYQVTLSQAKSMGKTACKKCAKRYA